MTVHRSETIGSLLRPQYLVDARQQLERGEIGAPAFKRIEDRAVDESVALQEAAGLDVITDGEQRRYAFFGHLIDAFEGFDKFGGWAIPFRDDAGVEVTLKRPVVVEKLRWRRHMAAEEFTYLRARTTRAVKATLLSAQQAAAYYDPDKSRAAYPTRDAYLADLVDFTRRGSRSYSAWDAKHQIDAPQYAALLDEKIREGYRRRGSDPDRLLDACIELDNAIIDGHAGVTFGIHICRGNYQSMFYASGGYDRIAQQVFGRSHFHRFLLEYDNARSGTFEPLAHVPDDRVVVLGLVSTKTARLETVDEAPPAHRRGRTRGAARTPGDQSAVRVRVHVRRQSPVARRSASEARGRRRDGSCGVAGRRGCRRGMTAENGTASATRGYATSRSSHS